jgi:hypothetical protein
VQDEGDRPMNGICAHASDGNTGRPETGALFTAGHSAWKISSSSAAGAGPLSMCLYVSLKAGAGSGSSTSFSSGAGFAGEMPALSVAHGAMFCPINCTGTANMVLAYGWRELTLAMFARSLDGAF